MDFENAAKRLERDQSKLRQRGRTSAGNRNARNNKVTLSDQAVREAARRREEQQQRAAERALNQKRVQAAAAYVRRCERELGVQSLSAADGDASSLRLQATSIYGEGDKIALPPSVLERLMNKMTGNDNNNPNPQQQQQQQQPWIFRLGIPNPDYVFPASPLLKEYKITDDEEDELEEDEEDSSHSNNSSNGNETEAYLDELQHKYLAYTHATVVEFTQEEGHVGLPEPVARALLRPHTSNAIPSLEATRTVDPSATAKAGEAMEVDNDDDEKTPGHLAWGAFDVPAREIEITRVQLPKGRTARLRPNTEAIRHGFYQLKDVKLVLEQSLVRTRATLSLGDLIHTWHRGVRFDLTVTQLTPPDYHSVSCINTDLEIDFEAATEAATAAANNASDDDDRDDKKEKKLGGRRLGGATTTTTTTVADASSSSSCVAAAAAAPGMVANPPPLAVVPSIADHPLPPEPPVSSSSSVVTVQIRAANAQKGQRRFDIRTATLRDLFAFAATVVRAGSVGAAFCLVTRFPRRVFCLDGDNATATLEQVGIAAGQELFLIEPL